MADDEFGFSDDDLDHLPAGLQGGQERRATLSLMPRPELGTTEGGVRLNRLDVQFGVGEGPEY